MAPPRACLCAGLGPPLLPSLDFPPAPAGVERGEAGVFPSASTMQGEGAGISPSPQNAAPRTHCAGAPHLWGWELLPALRDALHCDSPLESLHVCLQARCCCSPWPHTGPCSFAGNTRASLCAHSALKTSSPPSLPRMIGVGLFIRSPRTPHTDQWHLC